MKKATLTAAAVIEIIAAGFILLDSVLFFVKLIQG